MLNAEDNARLTQASPDAPAGESLRNDRFGGAALAQWADHGVTPSPHSIMGSFPW